MLLPAKIAACTFLLAASLFAQPKEVPAPQSSAKAAPAVLTVEGLGQGAIPLDGPWQFHTGDNPEWASPSFDDSTWEAMQLNGPWGSQSHPGYTGYAWYRRHVQIHTIAGSQTKYALLMPPVDDAYEIFWNGKPIGQFGKFPPRPRWYYSTFPQTFPVPSAQSGTIAIRVWKSPLLFVDPDSLGGMYGPPLLGDADTIDAQLAAFNAQNMRQNLYDYTLVILYGFVTLLSLLLWSRNRKVKLFLWLAIFTATPVMLFVIQGVLQIPIYYGFGRGFNQPIYALNHVSLWFLLLYLLRLDDRPTLARWTRVLAIITVVAGVLDGALAFFWGHAGAGMLALDAFLTTLILIVEVFPFVIIAIGIRQRLEPSRWWLAISAFVSQMINTIADASAAGQRFTHWTLYYRVTTPLFAIFGVHFTAADLAGIGLFLSILYAVYRYNMEQQARQTALEQEMQSAREIQRVLIPETLPSLDGFAMSSAYQPAQEVGGDFFQIIREDGGSAIVALGDVSGKGLKAAMSVSLIVGVLRSLSGEKSSPVQMLQALNRCLCGRLQGGFVTAIVMRLFPSGKVILANAGHLPPFLNSGELEIEGSLPLGLISFAEYSEMQIQLHPGDNLSLYTDGLVEARSPTGEIYGFERLNTLFATHPTAQQATQAAVAFGQEDDITVLTLTRLSAGEESSTSLTAPFLEPAPAEA
ncbi:MAG TPA: SpoIIE family protein phosphatase [Acidobacteriaceae bacterium]|nr:SpoIIE family protein phosphatase [Acidobacteriaceae bacterium]